MTESVETTPSEGNLPAIAEFSLRIVYPFGFASSPRNAHATPHPEGAQRAISPEERRRQRREQDALPFAQLDLVSVADKLPLPEELRGRFEKARADGKAMTVWDGGPDAARSVTLDLYPHLRRLLRPDPQTSSVGFQLSYAAWQLLEGGYGDFGPGLEFRLSKVARKRLDPSGDAPEWVRMSAHRGLSKLARPRLHLFGIGIGVLEVEFSPAPDFLARYGREGIHEFIYSLAHIDDRANVRWAETATPAILANCMRALLPEAGTSPEDAAPLRIEPLAERRLFTFACVRLADGIDTSVAKTLARRMARRQTAHYLSLELSVAARDYAAFQNIVFAMCTEGGAVVVGTPEVGGSRVEFFRTFLSDRIRTAYWPMTLLTYVEHLKLVELTGDVCREVDFRNPTALDHRILDDFRTQILNFRLNYRFSQASQIAQHNEYFAVWRDVFGSERMIEELDGDVAEVDQYLAYKLDEKKLRTDRDRHRFYEKVGIGVSAVLFLFSMFGMSLAEVQTLSVLSPTVILISVAVLAIAIGFIVVRVRQERASDRAEDESES